MTITGALVIFAVLWFLGLLVALPIGETSQEEDGEVVPGTPASAPIDPMMKKKLIWVTIVTFLIWVPICLVIASGWITIRDIDFFNRMG
ncbi:DUF1467 family protein [Oceanomicrobium pacificus]|uniref:DUF1467 family protein n=1 Tax=Oceanomicrobium pacificus TaxID=2692916 RepID=A0A6B0TNC0_9RHOB|nr:DUF1467 family protein [Oceanomicrobium pacificus]MXU64079.1 DUF1467 family protein [Oceanomicrobium pacificus]